MPLAVKRYLACLVVISLLMAVYSMAMTPLLRSPEHANQAWQEPEAARQTVGWWRDLFPADAWQNQNPMVIQTQQGTLLFQEITKTANNDTMRLSPLTLIIPMSDASHEPVVGDLNASLRVYQQSQLAVVLAPEGAEIQFREVPDWASGTAPPVKEGKLLGAIRIVGMNPRINQATGQASQSPPVEWQIDTSTVRISGRHVWTNNEVTLKFGDNEAVGKDISIFLKQDLMGKRTGNDGPWGLLDYMEIRTLKEVTASLPPGGLWKGLKLGPPELAAAHENVPARLRLTCKGIFQFDFDESEAKLSDHVLLEHGFGKEPTVDTFTCHELVARFSESPVGGAPHPNAVMVGPMKLDRVDAVAIDSVPMDSVGPLAPINRVKLNAPNIAAAVDAKRIEVVLDDETKGQCFAINSVNGRNSNAARQPSTPVAINYMGTTIHATELKYVAEPNQLHPGWLDAIGPGDIETSENSPIGRATASWQTRLVMRPAETYPMHVINLTGRAEAKTFGRAGATDALGNSGFLRSEEIVVTLHPASDQLAGSKMMRVKRLYAGDPKNAERADSSHAEVEMGNASQNVRVKELHLNFVYAESPSAAPAQNSLELTDAAGRPMRQWLGQPASTNANGSRANPAAQAHATSAAPSVAATAPPGLGLPLNLGATTTAAPAGMPPNRMAPGSLAATASPTNAPAPATPVVILGKALYSDIVIGAAKPYIEKLLITGPVVISPKGPPQNEAPVWRIDGVQLQLKSDVDDHYQLQIAGGPARITFGDGWLEGPTVQLDQRSGHVWIEKEGAFCIPPSLMQNPTNSMSNNRGNPQLLSQPGVQWLQPIKCSWRGDMLFNGLTANILGKITFNEGIARTGPDRLLFVEGSCESLEVRMTEPINMGNPGKTNATAQSLTLRDNVYIRTDQTDLRKNFVSKEVMLVPEVSYEVATNIIRSRGPGELHSQHQSSGGLGALASQGKPVNRPSPGASPLQGMHLRFRDSMELLLAEKRLSFMGKVEVGMGPLQSLDQQIDINSMRVLQKDQSLLNGDLLRIYDASDVTHRPTATMADGNWEFAAQGNVFFESRSDSGELVGKAAELTYVQSKDLLIIRGDTRIPAEIRVKPQNSEQGALGIFNLNRGSFNTKTFGQEGDLQIASVQWVPHGSNVPANWKTGALVLPANGPNNGPNNGLNNGLNNGGPAAPNAPAPPRPRDGLQNWMRPQ